MKLTFDRQRFVNNSSAEFNENPTNGYLMILVHKRTEEQCKERTVFAYGVFYALQTTPNM